jgi:putative transposase
VRRTFKFQLRPTAGQAVALGQMLADHRDLYNAALQERRDAYRHRSKTTVRYGDQSAQLKDIRAFDPDQARWSFSSQQATLRRLDKAFTAFFRRVRAGEAPGYPRFKGAGWFDTVEWPKDGDGCRWNSVRHPTQTRVRLQGVGHVKVNQHRPITGTVKTVSVKREGSRWYVILSCDNVPAEPLAPTGAVVGVDMGVASFLTTSDGVHVPNPRHLAASDARLAAARQVVDRRKQRSAGREGPRSGRRGAQEDRPAAPRPAHKAALDLAATTT